MRKNILRRLLLFGIFALTIISCEDESSSTSVITSFTKFPVVIDTATPAIAVLEDDAGVYTFDFAVDSSKQITDMTITIGIGAATTATEGVDFELVTHDVEIAAFEGSFSVDVEVLEDFEIEDGDEEIYLTFTSENPSGVELSETKVITIEDNGDEGLVFDLTWDLDSELPTTNGGIEACDLDFDLTINTDGANPYASDLMGLGAAGSACGESGRFSLSTMTDAVVYNVWVSMYGPGEDYGDFGLVNVHVGFNRKNTAFTGTADIEGVFDLTIDATGAGGIFMTVEKNANVVTLKDAVSGDIIGEGLVSNSKLIPVKKPG